MKRILSPLALAAALLPLSAQAIEYTQVQAAKSRVIFTYQQMGVAVDGHFRKFSGQLSFDPAKPTAARVSFDVDPEIWNAQSRRNGGKTGRERIGGSR